nr:DUF4328 domain-containing protein [Pleionea sp. CnH1-48]
MLTLLFLASIVLTLVELLFVGGNIEVLRNTTLPPDQIPQPEGLEAFLKATSSAVGISLNICFIIWFKRSYQNLKAWGVEGLGWSPLMAILCWFIPLANLVIPLLIAIEIDKASRPESIDQDGKAWKSLPVDRLVLIWWASFVGAILVSVRPMIGYSGTMTHEFLIGVLEQQYIAAPLTILSAYFAMRMVQQINRNQVQRQQMKNNDFQSFMA